MKVWELVKEIKRLEDESLQLMESKKKLDLNISEIERIDKEIDAKLSRQIEIKNILENISL